MEAVRHDNREIVRFEKAGLAYEDAPETLTDVTMTLKEGEFRFLTGPSGAGKTSLLKLIYLAHKPTRGRFFLFGENAAEAPREALPALRRRIGVVFQEFRLLDHLTAYENVALPMKVAGVNQNQYREDVSELLNWVGLGDRMHANPPTLSGGEKQRVALARALVSKPDLILADEPTGNLDGAMAIEVMEILQAINLRGTTVMVATHDTGLMNRFPFRKLRFEAGRLVES